MMLEKLSEGLQGALSKLMGAGHISEPLVNDVVKDIQRALLSADVNVKLVLQLSNNIKQQALHTKPPAGASPKAHVLSVVYRELVGILGRGTTLTLGKHTIMLVGLQGSGKTSTTAKLARYFQRKGLRPYVICADTYRPGAYEQLSTLCERLAVPFYGEKDTKDAVGLVERGLKEAAGHDVVLIDTAGRHALESELIEEMKAIHAVSNPDHTFLVLDAALGQGASVQARAFNEAVGITGIIITKLDGTAKGGGALSAVAETGAPIAFIGTGETPDELEPFDPERFISKLLGMGDIQSLIERAQETLREDEIDVNKLVSGRFTLRDFYKQLEAMNKLGPLKQVMQMLPFGGMGIKLTEKDYEMTKSMLSKFKVIMDSMTSAELDDPKLIDQSRIVRIARGSGTTPEDVRALLKYYRTMQKAMKSLGSGRLTKSMMKRLGVQ
ncbi:signal recognition particle protein Srp54 [Methermicoccus shengliensis]|uniref:Signal recognition particle 54 kDa protein n=1 Tax=Methermicoccus shengliensis TaxID=660064 RepID=A0A832VX34_9EURY|nr:signal recognition particle protein Srp54 [Methermicoccus shengliensis]HIH69557.1 signal recognition particle protein [Methermicoccus shengliensis]